MPKPAMAVFPPVYCHFCRFCPAYKRFRTTLTYV